MTSAKQIYLGVHRGAPTPPLPYDADVEYIESTGTQYINTGYSTDCLGITIDITASKTTSSTSEMALIGMVDPNIVELYFGGGSIRLWSRPFNLSSQVSVSVDTAYHIVAFVDAAEQSLSVDGVATTRTGSMGSYGNSPLTIFNYNGRYVFVGRVYGCKIYDGSTLVRDFVPVRFTNELGQSEGAMYDRVSGQLFRNAGTGAFKFGTDTAGGGYKWLGYSPLRFSRSTRLWKEAA